MTTEKIISSLSKKENLDKLYALICAKDEYRLGADCLSHMPLEEETLLKAYDHFTNSYAKLCPFEEDDEIKGTIAQALERKAFTCLKLSLICKPALYNLLANDYLNLALTYATPVKQFNTFRANVYLALSVQALRNNDLTAAETNLTAGFQELILQDDVAARQVKRELNECLKKYKSALGLEAASALSNSADVNECHRSEYTINVRGL